MNIQIPYSWLREYLETNAKPKDVANILTSCGPTVERTIRKGNDYIFDIEITTNRVDLMSIYGLAREASAILPQFGFSAKLKPLRTTPIKSKKELGIKIVDKNSLSKRTLAIKLGNIKLKPSPNWLKEKLIKVGQRPLINAVDITNYVMWETGHPIHAFDYDKLKTKTIVFREATKGEKLITLDNKRHILNGGEVIFDDGEGRIIDLPGIMGVKNTVVNKQTKNVLLWTESIKPAKIRYASMELAIRSQAAILNEKNVDPEAAYPTMLRAIELFQQLCDAKIKSELVDIYPKRYKPKTIKLGVEFINQRLGISLKPKDVKNLIERLGFTIKINKREIIISVPSFRYPDITLPEDIVEEVARIYGYHNIPNQIMSGALPQRLKDSPFDFEYKLKQLIKLLGGSEIYTLSLVSKEWVDSNAIKLKNPLGKDSQYLRTSLMPSLINAADENSNEKDPFFLFEMANIYLSNKKRNDSMLPLEKMIIAGVLINYQYRKAKGIIEKLIDTLNIKTKLIPEDKQGFGAGKRLAIYHNKDLLGEFGITETGPVYFELDVKKIRKYHQEYSTFKPLPKYPAQIEDITLSLPERIKLGNLLSSIKKSDSHLSKVELTDTFEKSATFQLYYQDPKKTLTDKEVEKIRNKILKEIKNKYGAIVKE